MSKESNRVDNIPVDGLQSGRHYKITAIGESVTGRFLRLQLSDGVLCVVLISGKEMHIIGVPNITRIELV